jgi:hypothetical protein
MGKALRLFFDCALARRLDCPSSIPTQSTSRYLKPVRCPCHARPVDRYWAVHSVIRRIGSEDDPSEAIMSLAGCTVVTESDDLEITCRLSIDSRVHSDLTSTGTHSDVAAGRAGPGSA